MSNNSLSRKLWAITLSMASARNASPLRKAVITETRGLPEVIAANHTPFRSHAVPELASA